MNGTMVMIDEWNNGNDRWMKQNFLLNNRKVGAFDELPLCFRSSHPKVFCKKDVIRNFAKFTGKHLYQSLFFNKVAGL